jgi:hypothetical protein
MARDQQPRRATQPVCPHAFIRIRDLNEIPAQGNNLEYCPICYLDWSTRDDDHMATPMLIGHCLHAICRYCFKNMRSQLGKLDCIYGHCSETNGEAPLNLASCIRCQNWYDEHAEPAPDKKVLIVRPDMVKDIMDTIEELRHEDKQFRLAGKVKKLLVKVVRATLEKYAGQYHRWYHLAEILDPFRDALDDLDDDIAEIVRLHPDILKPFSGPKELGFLPPHWNQIQFAGGVEGWVSTVIRTFMQTTSIEEGIWVGYEERGVVMDRHKRDKPSHHRRNICNQYIEEWPVKRILAHRQNHRDKTEYQIQYLGFDRPEDSVWKTRAQVPGLGHLIDKFESQDDENSNDNDSPDEDEEMTDVNVEDEDETMTDEGEEGMTDDDSEAETDEDLYEE